MSQKSLDLLEKEYFAPQPSPFEAPVLPIAEVDTAELPHSGLKVISLNGRYEMLDGDNASSLHWENSVPADIPCTVQTALYAAGKIPDPLYAKNDSYARAASYKTWWFRKEFDYDGSLHAPRLCFDGVCHKATFWLNGTLLGEHIGMFGGPDFAVESLLQPHNTLLVKIENSPADPHSYSEYADYDDGWKNGVVVNCVYGWHYACIPSRGIWQSVWLKETPLLTVERPFLLTEDYKTGTMGLCIGMNGSGKGKIKIQVTPYHREGSAQCFCAAFTSDGRTMLHYRLRLQNAVLWWPNGYGEQNLYRFAISIEPENDLPQCFDEVTGIRQIEMLPIGDAADPKMYNWHFTVNGKYIFLKGTNWCTTDALMRFPDERYDRFLGLAKHQNLQLLRAWGGGMPESDYFYRKCDELGLLVAQEWPTCWDSQKTQPMAVLEETALRHTVRLRNHPSLIQWAGGNESAKADGPCMDALARIAYELDGTRPFHRTSPYGGSLHNYETFWEMKEMDCALRLRAPFIGEFGMASSPNRQSVQRYIPENEWHTWCPTAKNAFNYHMPRFNEFRWPEEYNDMDHLLLRAEEFCPIESLDDFIFGTQMAQATAIRHTLEAQRADSPRAAGVCYYKLTDVYPACSWSTIDYYGVPKLPYYVFQNAYAPLHAMLKINSIHAAKAYPLVLLDDAGAAVGKHCRITVTFFDRALQTIKTDECVVVPEKDVNEAGTIELTTEQAAQIRIISVRLYIGDSLADDTFYVQNYKEDSDCLRRLPHTALRLLFSGNTAVIENTGDAPAVGVFLENPTHDTVFTTEKNLLLLLPHETRHIAVNITDGITVHGFNC